MRLASDVEYEAEIRLLGRPMLDYVLDGIQESQYIDRIVVVGPPFLSRSHIEWVPMTQDLLNNIMVGLKSLESESLNERVLVATADIPLIQGKMIDAFIEQAPEEAELVYSVISRQVTEERFPGIKRTYVKLRDGVFTGGNIFLMKAGVFSRIKGHAEQLLSHRKAPLLLARDIGFRLLLKYALGRLSIHEAETRVAQMLGIVGRALILPFPEVGVDVDKPSDLQLVEQYLRDEQNRSKNVW